MNTCHGDFEEAKPGPCRGEVPRVGAGPAPERCVVDDESYLTSFFSIRL